MCIEASHSKQSRIGESNETDLTATRNDSGNGNGNGNGSGNDKMQSCQESGNYLISLN